MLPLLPPSAQARSVARSAGRNQGTLLAKRHQDPNGDIKALTRLRAKRIQNTRLEFLCDGNFI